MSTLSSFKEWSDQGNGNIDILIHGGRVTVHNRFGSPATDQEIEQLSDFFSRPLPDELYQFLKTCNGASLFEDLSYGGESIIYSTADIMTLNESTSTKIIVANILDDRILIDLDHTDKYMLLCESLNPIEESRRFSCDFETWLERFILSQGSKFWYWSLD